MAKLPYSNRISSILLNKGLISEEALTEAEAQAKIEGVNLEHLLIDKDLISPYDLAIALSGYLKYPVISLKNFTMPAQVKDFIQKDVMTKKMVVPLALCGKNLTLALADPFDLMTIDDVEVSTGYNVMPVIGIEEEISICLSKMITEPTEGLDMEELMRSESNVEVLEEDAEEQSLDDMLQSAEGAPVIRMVNLILVEALRTGASDIHIDPMEKKVRLRYRIDGMLVEKPGPPKTLQAAVSSRIKIMSDLNIAERRIPQDGRFNIKALGKEIDLRVSILPTIHGEKIVMRILDKSSLVPGLSYLGLEPKAEEAMKYGIDQPHGIILVTGPTGSGKTTTLYSCLQDLNQPDVNIITCEDPVEYQLKGVNQIQINADVGLSFAAALRSILRQDPDIVLVGEIRDGETAQMAIKAALTGHLVLSTLHTNDSAGAVTRLIDMGVERFMLGSSLVLAQAQRLYRKLCPACKKVTQVDALALELNNIPSDMFEGVDIYDAVGCPRCTNGFKGRGAIMEVLLVNDAIREAILRGDNASQLRAAGIANGMVSLKQAGLERVRDGITSLTAALEVTGGD
jgi:type IV pilus assembly protein PilB